ncbi:hypothetical protein QQ045_012460 [Rhodiola kirilowii]
MWEIWKGRNSIIHKGNMQSLRQFLLKWGRDICLMIPMKESHSYDFLATLRCFRLDRHVRTVHGKWLVRRRHASAITATKALVRRGSALYGGVAFFKPSGECLGLLGEEIQGADGLGAHFFLLKRGIDHGRSHGLDVRMVACSHAFMRWLDIESRCETPWGGAWQV